jgi:hypothetical protein
MCHYSQYAITANTCQYAITANTSLRPIHHYGQYVPIRHYGQYTITANTPLQPICANTPLRPLRANTPLRPIRHYSQYAIMANMPLRRTPLPKLYKPQQEHPGGMPWDNQEEKKKKKQGSNSSRLVFIFHTLHPEEQCLAILLERAKYLNLWHKHWGGIAFRVEQPDFTTPVGVKVRYIEIVWSHMKQCN